MPSGSRGSPPSWVPVGKPPSNSTPPSRSTPLLRTLTHECFTPLRSLGCELPARLSAFRPDDLRRGQLVSGTVVVKFNPADKPRPLAAKPGRTTIWVGAVLVGGEKGGKVIVFETGKEQKEVDIAPGTEARPFPISTVPSVVKLASDLDGLMMGTAGETRGAATTLYAPADGSRLIPGDPVRLRWQATRPGVRLHLSVFARGEKDPIWEEGIAGEKGVMESALLGARLAERHRAGARSFFLRIQVDGNPRGDDNKFSLLSADEQAELADRLKACDQAEKGPLRHLLRAAVYRRLEIIEAGIIEFDRLLEHREYGNRPEIIHAARQLVLTSGDEPRAALLATRLASVLAQ